MKVKYKVFSNLYQDSVSLMQISAQISKLPGIQQASVVMGTPNNLEQLRDAGLGNEINASPNDLVIAVMGEEDICNEALILAQQRLTSKPDDETGSGIKTPEKVSLEMALEAEPEANLALISVPGDYAAAEAIKALNLGMNVMMFSDNVSIAQEKSIKTLARERQRIVMGPDCGTAIVNGIPLGFANVVKRGAIGVIGASGTGLQEVTCRIDQLGVGISQALGTGGHDLSEEIGGISMLFALDALAQDDETRVIVLISKPPSPIVARTILERAEACGKPVVVNFLGANPHDLARPNITAFHHTCQRRRHRCGVTECSATSGCRNRCTLRRSHNVTKRLPAPASPSPGDTRCFRRRNLLLRSATYLPTKGIQRSFQYASCG